MKDLSLRSALGVESCKWNTAGQFALPLRHLDFLSSDDDEDRTCKRIAQEFYDILFRPFGKSLVDNKRRCAWYFGRDVRLGFLSSDAFVTSTDIMTASGS